MIRDKALPRAAHLDGYGQRCNCASGCPEVKTPASSGNGSESRTPKPARLRGSTLLNNYDWLQEERREAERWERGKERES